MSDAKQIYVDMDDVLAETGRTFLSVLESDFGKRVEWDQLHDYDLGVSLGLDEKSLTEFMHAIHEPEVLASVEPIPGALAALERWIERGYEIEVVTGRPSSTEEISRNWLKNNEMPHHSLIHVDKYAWEEELMGTSSGVPLVRLADNGYCLAVEDSAEVAIHLTEIIDAPVVVLDRPWNRRKLDEHANTNGRIVRCESWAEIFERFPSP
jgi:uncharacterized HAD superfamily protein